MEQSFLEEWFQNKAWWFSKDPIYDSYITTKYEGLVGKKVENMLCQVLIYDQLPRHVFRGSPSQHIILYYLEKAIHVVMQVQHNHSFVNSLSNTEWMFFMLPLRHSQQLDKILQVMHQTWHREADETLRKFIRATYANCPTEDQSHCLEPPSSQDLDVSLETFHNILDFTPSSVYVPLQRSFTCHFDNMSHSGALLISLSGGVDSMVTLMAIKSRFPEKQIVAVHINYCNRSTSHQEAMFARWWCRMHGIPFYQRSIQEIQRPPCMQLELRDLYETYTKNVRFGTYKTVWKHIGQEGIPRVVLGHNKDDCLENILTNMTFGSKYDNLDGMLAYSQQQGIVFLRPLLGVTKETIIHIAKQHHIPYLYDSTPLECQRGMIRSKIVPVLLEWNAKSVEGLFEMSKCMSSLCSVLDKSVQTFCKNMDLDQGIELHVHEITDSSLFWKKVCLGLYGIVPSKKALQCCMEKIAYFQQSYMSMELHTSHTIVLKKNLKLIVQKRRNDKLLFRFLCETFV